MNKIQAKETVRKVLQNTYDKVEYRNFVLNLLHDIDESKKAYWNITYVKTAFKEHVKGYERLGTYTSPDGETLDVLIVHLTTVSKLERARSAIRNFVAHHLMTRDNKDAALVAYVPENEKQWRFSFVRMEYASKRDPASGKIAVEEKLTPARRYSYLVGEAESCHTAQTRFLPLLQETSQSPTLSAIEAAFSVETVTDEFFKQYKTLFHNLCEELDGLVAKDKVIREDFASKKINTTDFAKKLLGQIVFLYFLQKKGWLGVPKNGNWGEGRTDFLKALFRGEFRSYKNFFDEILEPLFYDTLANDRGHPAWCETLNCRIPFLNGGLFEPLSEYDWEKTRILLPNTLFSNTEVTDAGDTGSGILDVFDRYNFTVNEAEPLEKDVAIDPEMLGKVFEKLLDVKERKSKGSFYTPREVVHHMCRETLVNYLDGAMNVKAEPLTDIKPGDNDIFRGTAPEQLALTAYATKTLVPRDDIEALIYSGEQASNYETARIDGTKRQSRQLPKSIEKHARLLDEKLADIAACDPAIGSGAFPVGMMQEIVRARESLTPYFNDIDERTPYHFKRHAIQHCLYGVDIDPGAVEIAKLRLWLSLVVDELDVKQVKPLPNLDYKIVAGNSLLGFPFMTEKLKDIERLKDKFFGELDHDRKAALKKEVDNRLASCFANSEKHLGYKVDFDFGIFFSEVFRRQGGFDVVIGNPPYIGESGHKELFRKTKIGPLGEYYRGKMDYFYFFFHLALNLVRTTGEISFITTNYYLTATGAQKLRADFKRRAQIRRLVNFNELRIFESALGQHNLITTIRKGVGIAPAQTCITYRTGPANPTLLDNILQRKDTETNYYEVAQADIYDGKECYMRLSRTRSPAGIQKSTIDSILDKAAEHATLLEAIAHINQGVVSGCDYVSAKNSETLPAFSGVDSRDGIFVLNLDNPRDMAAVRSFNDKEIRLLRLFYKNSDISRYSCSDTSQRRLLYIDRTLDDLKEYPNILVHLNKFKHILSKRREVQNGVIKFHQLQWPRSESIFLGKKIVVPYRSLTNAFAYNESEWFCRSDCYVITEKHPRYPLKYLLALLNSRMVYYWLFYRGKRKGAMLELFQAPLSEIPIPVASKPQQQSLIKLVDHILSAKKKDSAANVAAWEREIDRLVYGLYELTEGDVELIEGTVKETSAATPQMT